MKNGIRVAVGSLIGVVVLGLLLFLPAGTLGYWQAWVFIALFTAAITGQNVYLAVRRPEVLHRRLRSGPTAETRPVQKLASVGYVVVFAVMAVVSALDYRFGWSQVPVAVVVVGEILVATGLGFAVFAVLQNSYASANVVVGSGQEVVSTGLYGLVRHPMYLGVLIMMIGAPLALGSYWGLVMVAPTVAVVAIRIADEEKLLSGDLAGYSDYTRKVRHRLVPYVW